MAACPCTAFRTAIASSLTGAGASSSCRARMRPPATAGTRSPYPAPGRCRASATCPSTPTSRCPSRASRPTSPPPTRPGSTSGPSTCPRPGPAGASCSTWEPPRACSSPASTTARWASARTPTSPPSSTSPAWCVPAATPCCCGWSSGQTPPTSRIRTSGGTAASPARCSCTRPGASTWPTFGPRPDWPTWPAKGPPPPAKRAPPRVARAAPAGPRT